MVYAFGFDGHLGAALCCAWPFPVEGSGYHRFDAVLGTRPIGSAIEAVPAAIIGGCKAGRML